MLLVVFSFCLNFVLASDGDLDATFSGDGKVTTAISSNSDRVHSICQQSDGKLVVAGHSYNANSSDFAVARYTTSGSLDTGFDSDGWTEVTIGSGYDFAKSVIQQSDGKIVVAGYFNNGTNDIALVRLNSDGSLDTGFDSDGIATLNITNENDSDSEDACIAVAQQSDGKLVAFGYAELSGGERRAPSSGYYFAARYASDGSLDTDFGTSGIAMVAEGSYCSTEAGIIQADGKLVILGYNNDNYSVILHRLNSDGSLDTGFDSDGTLAPTLPTGSNHAYGLAQQSDGKLVIAGDNDNSGKDYLFARFNSDGSADTGFDTDGIVEVDNNSGTHDIIYALAIQGDGKIVGAGQYYSGSHNFAVVVLNSDGSLDTGFDSDGIAVTDIGTGGDVAYAICQQSDGKLVAAGYADSGNEDFALVRYAQTDVSLPVDLLNFTGNYSRSGVDLKWSTASEIENLGFILERRIAGENKWLEIANFNKDSNLSGQGSVNYQTDYWYCDKIIKPGFTYEYRLSDVDYSGFRKYHPTIIISIENSVLAKTISRYPNPFNTSMNIDFTLVGTANVDLQVFNTQGQLVVNLLQEKRNPGYHTIQWQASDLNSGVYFVRFNSVDMENPGNSVSEIEKCILVK